MIYWTSDQSQRSPYCSCSSADCDIVQLRIVVVCTFKDVLAKRSISRRWVADVPSPGALPQSRLPHPSPEAPTALPDTVSPCIRLHNEPSQCSPYRLWLYRHDPTSGRRADTRWLDDCDESIEQFMQPNLPFTFDILLSLRVRIHLIKIYLSFSKKTLKKLNYYLTFENI